MKYSLVILLISLGLCQALLGPIGEAVNRLKNDVENKANQVKEEVGKAIQNTGNQVKTHVENAVGHLLGAVNEMRFSGKFLWETVFDPTFDLIIQNGQAVVDGQFGAFAALANTTITIPPNPLSDKYAQLTTLFKSNIQHLYSQLFLLEQEAIKALENGEADYQERLQSLEQQLEAIKTQMEAWARETKEQLEAYASTLSDDLQTIVHQYEANIDSAVRAMEQIFEKITQSLAKNLLDVAQSVAPNTTSTSDSLSS